MPPWLFPPDYRTDEQREQDRIRDEFYPDPPHPAWPDDAEWERMVKEGLFH